MKGKVAVVTGGTRGIGFRIAKSLLKNQYDVVVNYHSNRRLAKLALKELKEISDNMIAIQADVTIKEERQRSLEEILSHFGRIDLLVNSWLLIDSVL